MEKAVMPIQFTFNAAVKIMSKREQNVVLDDVQLSW